MSAKWGDAELDRAQFAQDQFFSALDNLTEEIGKAFDKERAGSATAADIQHRRELQTRWREVVQEIADIGNRLFRGDHLPPSNMN